MAEGARVEESRRITPVIAALREDFRKLLARYEHRALDSGYGDCPLRMAQCREILSDVLREGDERDYRLDRFVIMPNHVHLLVLPLTERPLGTLVGGWKRHSARLINRTLGKSDTLWQQESFDHVVRSAEKLKAFRRYIEANPVKAKLSAEAYTVGCGSGIAL